MFYNAAGQRSAARLQEMRKPHLDIIQSIFIEKKINGLPILKIPPKLSEECSQYWKFDWTNQPSSAGSKSTNAVDSLQPAGMRIQKAWMPSSRSEDGLHNCTNGTSMLLAPASRRPRSAQCGHIPQWGECRAKSQVGGRWRRPHRHAANRVNGSGGNAPAHTLRAI